MKKLPGVFRISPGALLALFGPTCALAQTHDIFTTLGAGTDYRAKGISKSLDDGTFSIATEWSPKDRPIYAGVAAATVDLAIGASYEADVKIGVRPKAMGWAFDFAIFYRAFPDAAPGSDKDYVEARAQASRSWGPVNLRLLSWQTPDNFGPARESNWSEARVSWTLSPHVRASAALGHHDQESAPTYSAWNAGLVIKPAPSLDLDFRWYDTDGHAYGPRFDGEAVATVTYTVVR